MFIICSYIIMWIYNVYTRNEDLFNVFIITFIQIHNVQKIYIYIKILVY